MRCDDCCDQKVKEQLNQKSHPEIKIVHSHESPPASRTMIEQSTYQRGDLFRIKETSTRVTRKAK